MFSGIEKEDIKTVLPVAEIITVSGFFAVCFLEEFLHHFLHPHEPDPEESKENVLVGQKKQSIVKKYINSCLKRDYPPPSSNVELTSATNANGINMDEFHRYDKNLKSESAAPVSASAHMQNGVVLPSITNANGDPNCCLAKGCPKSVLFDAMAVIDDENAAVGGLPKRRVSRMLSGDGTQQGLQAKTSIRTFFVVCALSFHSVIEGLALGLEEDDSGVWMSFAAVAMHKFVIAFSVGVELLAAEVSKNYQHN